jgi:hypothetical protein
MFYSYPENPTVDFNKIMATFSVKNKQRTGYELIIERPITGKPP